MTGRRIDRQEHELHAGDVAKKLHFGLTLTDIHYKM
jgi:hypothetical protein